MLSVRFRRRDRHPEASFARLLTAAEAAADPVARAIGFAGRADEVASGRDASGRLVVLAGLGARADASSVRAAAGRAAAAAIAEKRLVVEARGLSPELAAEAAVGATLRAWRFDRLRTRPEQDVPRPRLKHLEVLTEAKRDAGALWETHSAGVAGALFARDLVSEPANRLTPTVFAARLRGLAEEGIEVEIRDRDWLARRGFGALLGVARGSANPPCLAVLRWKGTIDRAPVAFVGKGVTFDTGGVDLKPAERMWEMRADMAGAAACAGAMLALARRRSPCPAIAVLGLVENMIGAEAQRPSDVVRAVDGTTIEVIDTDAEGRLVLADCLAWTRLAYAPAAMIDLATLTGSIVVALGNHRAGMFASDAALAAHLAAAGEAVDEPVWPMPLDEAYAEALKSDIADLKNCVAERFQPDACHAAIFLKRFAADTPWVHLDIAGVDLRPEAGDLGPAGATGFGVRLLDRLVALRFEDPTREAGRMAEIGFYHLTRTALEVALPKLLGRVLASGGRAVVKAATAERIAALDAALWLSPDPDWLPHGSAATGEADLQPIWLTTEDESPNGARHLFLVEGAESAILDRFDRVFDLFDGNDEAAVAAARERWRRARAAGHSLTYWRQTATGWERAA